jgi:hypothetical protein
MLAHLLISSHLVIYQQAQGQLAVRSDASRPLPPPLIGMDKREPHASQRIAADL